MDDYYKAVDVLGDKILERAEAEAGALRALPSSSILRRTGESGRLIPKGGEEDPGEVLRRLKDEKLVSGDIEHWGAGIQGDGKIYLSDNGEACKIDKRGVPYKVGSDGRRIVPTRRPKHLYTPEEWDKMDVKAKDKAYKKAKRERAKDAKKTRKRAAVGKKLVDKVLDKMIFPKIVQCDKIDLELGSSCTEGWEWAQESVQQQLQEEFLQDVVPLRVRRQLGSCHAMHNVVSTKTSCKGCGTWKLFQCHGYASSYQERDDQQSQSYGRIHERVERIVGSGSVRLLSNPGIR